MIVGVIIGEFVPSVQPAFNTVQFNSVSVPIAIGLIVMMYPVLTKVRYEVLLGLIFNSLFRRRSSDTTSPAKTNTRKLLIHSTLSFFLNWLIAPFVMLALAWATLPDLPTYRAGLILVGLARCIAMVLIWNELAGGDREYCAILVVMNSLLQIVIYSPMAVFFINIIGHAQGDEKLRLEYGNVAISVLIYLGIPLGLGLITRLLLLSTPRTTRFLNEVYIPLISPITFIGLLYTIIVMFAYQGHHILHNIGKVFRVMVPLVLYFCIMWSMTFGGVWWIGKHQIKKAEKKGLERELIEKEKKVWSYEMAAVQAFTAGSNNFELAIAVAIAVYGVGSDQALAATIGPLVEVPVLLALTWVAVWLKRKMWHQDEAEDHASEEEKV
ncbi:sodium bile acid symporter family-domain-containing protein [Abortiporus biennis]|nr:sodium bile acid symporter family-domain-containing protein [Abortiporus biennis]